MSQPSIASYFHSRKRAGDEVFNAKNKLMLLDPKVDNVIPKPNKICDVVDVLNADHSNEQPLTPSTSKLSKPNTEGTPFNGEKQTSKGRKTPNPNARPARRCLKRPAETAALSGSQPKIVKFTLAGNLSPKKKAIGRTRCDSDKSVASVTAVLFGTKESICNVDRGMKTPTKEEQVARLNVEKVNTARKNLTMDEIKSKVTKSSRLQDLKASMGKLQALEESRQRIISGNKTVKNLKTDKHSFNAQQSDRAAKILGQSLKPFETIDLEVLSSPQKGLTTPTKLLPPSSPAGCNEDVLMSPKKTITPRRIFSPSKTSIGSPTKSASVPAYQRFQSLAETTRATLQMPYKYRCLAETFKCLDTVCSMFFNRRETITMKKLKPAVQRMLRRNFSETSLAQIKFLYPDAYKFAQKKMLNAGSHTKFDYYQLVVTPNVQAKCETTIKFAAAKLNEDDIIRSGQEQTMNPQIMIERQQTFNNLLLNVVKEEHDKFLRSLEPPMIIPKEKINRWHAEFDLQNCPEIESAELPQPPNVEKFSSAKDILSTARNLFNCATPMERVMQRFEARKHQIRSAQSECTDTESEPPTPTGLPFDKTTETLENPVNAILKGVPKSLLERIRAKQAAKALDAMTRRPSQDKEAGRYERLPELARHLRNIFVTESKSVLELEIVLSKIENSFRERMTKDGLKELLQLIAKEAPDNWLSFHFIRKTDFIKIKKDVDLNEIIRHLELKATDKAR